MWVYIQTHAQVSDCNKGVKSTSTTVYWKNAVLKRLFDVCLLLEFLHWYLFSVLLSAHFNICDCALLFDLAKIINSTINKAINVFCPLLCVGGTMYNDQKGVGSGLSKTTHTQKKYPHKKTKQNYQPTNQPDSKAEPPLHLLAHVWTDFSVGTH